MSLSWFVKRQEVNAPYNLDFLRVSMPCRKKFSFKPIIRGLKKMPPFSHPLGKLARQMLAKSSADTHYLQRGEERRCHEINHTDSSIKKKNHNILFMLLLKSWKETGQGEPNMYLSALFTHNNNLNS